MKQVIAHRGASAYAPENTMAAFEKARLMGAESVEFDVMLSRDGEAFVFHDELLKRTTNGKGEFCLADAAYLSTLDAGSWYSKKLYAGEKIPTFETVLKWLLAYDIKANIEIKPAPKFERETTLTVLTQLHRLWPREKPLPLVSSFDMRVMRLCQEIAPETPRGLLLDKWDENLFELARDLDCFSVHLNKRDVSAKRVLDIKEKGYQVYVYTVNRKRQALKLLNWGVDAVFSDYPDLLTKANFLSLKRFI